MQEGGLRGMSPLRLGALDFSVIPDGGKPADGIWNTLELAQSLESMGYSRFWLAEHHTNLVAHSCPEIMTTLIAGITKRIRVGTAGILLRLYSPLKVASTFRLLHGTFPGRIDLGLARGYTSPEVAGQFSEDALREGIYESKVDKLLHFLRGTGPVVPNPTGIAPPEVWLLGSSEESARFAASMGVAFCLGMFLSEKTKNDYSAACHRYRSEFQPSRELSDPKIAIAIAGTCSENVADAAKSVRSHERSPVKVTPTVVGTPAECYDKFCEFEKLFDTEEIIFLDIAQEPGRRLASYSLLAEACRLLETSSSHVG